MNLSRLLFNIDSDNRTCGQVVHLQLNKTLNTEFQAYRHLGGKCYSSYLVWATMTCTVLDVLFGCEVCV